MIKRIITFVLLISIILCESACSSRTGNEKKRETETEAAATPAPEMKEGRYEEDENLLLPTHTYTLSSSHEVDGRQGIACEEGIYYVSGSATLSSYDENWKQLKLEEDPFSEISNEVNHIGDIDVSGGEIYAGVEHFMDGEAKNIQIAVYNAETLKLDRTFPVDPESGQTEVSGIAVDRDNKCIWMCSWADDESGRYLYAYSLETGEYVSKVHMVSSPRWIQGISYHDGWIYITSDDGDADMGEPDHVYRCQVDMASGSFKVVLERTLDDVTLPGEIEGISFDSKNHQMLISYNRGAQIVKGMPKGFYEGYDKEIHEIFVYDMKKRDRPLDYSLRDNWISLGGEETDTGLEADAFILLPTVNMRSLEPGNTNTTNLRETLRFSRTLDGEKGILEGSALIYAPLYRQATIGSFMGEDGKIDPEKEKADYRMVYSDAAYEDIRNAWLYYMENYNDGRPVVLFGYSQGGSLLLRLLEDLGEDESFRKQLVAAYVIGSSIYEDDLEEYPHLKMAQGESDTGVIISYNAVDSRMEMPEEKELSINPLNWKTDSTPASPEENLGVVETDSDGKVTKETPGYCGAYLDEKSGKLVVTDLENQDELYNEESTFFRKGDYHLYDLYFFYRNLEENVARRIESFVDAQ